MLARIISSSLLGIEGCKIWVEVDVSKGLPAFDIVGLPDSSVKESKERVRTAIKNSGFTFPVERITINLAPADIRKEGPSFDLPIAAGILACTGVFSSKALENTLLMGELSLDGSIKPVNGVLPMVYSAQKQGVKACIVPFENREEASYAEQMEIIGVKNLGELVGYLNKQIEITPFHMGNNTPRNDKEEMELNFSDIKGQDSAKRALEIAAAGSHNLLMIGPPGSGKTMLARRLPTILPPLSFEESIEVTKIYSVSGQIKEKNKLITRRPFRAPHHTISPSALTGGGKIPKPGEISLAHNGVLFLDELPEFQRNSLEILRQPMEDKTVTISRVNATVTYPADFMLIASMNPCPCGYLGDPNRCHCTQNEISKYLNKISGPLLDRIDIHIEVPAVPFEYLNTKKPQISSEEMRERVLKAREIQQKRYACETIQYNAQLASGQIEKYCPIGTEENNMLKAAFESLHLSARAHHKILKVARTVADIEGSKDITLQHIAEVIQYRTLDRKYWI